MIDLRSDTVTHPTRGMLHAIMEAEVGDDVFGEDPTVNRLEEKMAGMFGLEKAVFCPSGTMTNQIAVKVHTQPGDEVICDESSHIYRYEGGGMAFNSGVSMRLIRGDRGRITANDVIENINADDVHQPVTSLVSLENTCNKGGGAVYNFSDIMKMHETCQKHGLSFHLDGARLFNALAETRESTKDYGKLFDSISVCLSKGLGSPMGSVLMGSEHFIHKARRVRKVFGGAMRQAGYMAAAGIYALDHHVDRIREDHLRAKRIEKTLHSLPYVDHLLPVQSNIIVFRLSDSLEQQSFLNKLLDNGILAHGFGPQTIRMVTHLDIHDSDIERVESVLKQF
jgi:threonine aldolase